MTRVDNQRFVATTQPIGGQKEQLVIRDEDNLSLLGRFIRSLLPNILKDPRKIQTMKRLNLVVGFDPAGHPDDAVTVSFADGGIVLENGIRPNADIRIRCETAGLLTLARVPAGRAIVDYLKTHEGKNLIKKLGSGELKIEGIVRHPLGTLRFMDFMARTAD